MTGKVLGNHGPYVQHGISGSGTRNVPDLSIGWNQVMGKVGDYVVLAASEVHGRDLVHRGYFFQGDGHAGFTVEFTMSNSGEAKNPSGQSAVPWAAAPTGALTNLTGSAITDDNIYWYQGAFAAVKITFTAPGIMWIVAR
jgi:hypothetical protein